VNRLVLFHQVHKVKLVAFLKLRVALISHDGIIGTIPRGGKTFLVVGEVFVGDGVVGCTTVFDFKQLPSRKFFGRHVGKDIAGGLKRDILMSGIAIEGIISVGDMLPHLQKLLVDLDSMG